MERLYGQMEANPRNEPGSHKMRLKEHLNPICLLISFIFGNYIIIIIFKGSDRSNTDHVKRMLNESAEKRKLLHPVNGVDPLDFVLTNGFTSCDHSIYFV